jgi:hypothetical protein
LKKLASVDPTGKELWLEFPGGVNRLIGDMEFADLAAPGAERFYTRATLCKIFVNTRPKEVFTPKLTFWEVVKLAFRDASPSQTKIYTVTYKRDHPAILRAAWSMAKQFTSRTGCSSMSHQLIDRSGDLKQLRDEGYEVEVRANYLLVHSVPYVNAQKQVAFGTLVSELTLAGDVAVWPSTHVIHFAGGHPCDKDGTPIFRSSTRVRCNSWRRVLLSNIHSRTSLQMDMKTTTRR